MQKLLPPVLAALCLVAMLAGTLLISHAIADKVAFRVAGGIIGALGLSLAVAAKRQFQSAQTNVNTFDLPNILITSGCFRYSRNPMYLGLLLLLIGAALLLNNVWAIAGPLLFYFAASLWYIPYEEKAAQSVFGQAYLEYRQSVRRWL